MPEKTSPKESEGQLSQILQGSSVPTFVIDTQHLVTHWNKACDNLTGVSADEVIGTRKQWLAFYKDERPVMADLVIENANREEILKYYGKGYRPSVIVENAHEAEGFFPDIGESGKWLFFTAAPLKDGNGHVWGAIETLQDITERKRAEEALRDEMDRAQQYLDVAGVMILVLDVDRRIKLINRKGCDVLGYEETAIVGKNWFETCIPQRNRERAESMFARFIVGEMDRTDYFESYVLTQTGEERIMAWHNAILTDENDTVVGVLRSGEDITEKRNAEEKAREAETLKEVDRLRSELLANVSHELRTPLTIIKACSSMLVRCDEILEHDEKMQHLESIERSSSVLAELVDNLLDMSRLETGMLRMEKGPVDSGNIMREAAADAQVRIPDHKIVWKLPKVLPVVNADRRRIRQVVDNLIDNATKYSLPGTEVIIVCRKKGDGLLVSVADQGVGISENDLDRVFERMYRIEQETAPSVRGIGLGLALCKAIIEAHGGKIWMESEIGKGSSCFFTLPL